MNNTVLANIEAGCLPSLVRKAASQLASAENAAEVLEARDLASLAYDAAKRAARLMRAKNAHDELIAKAHRAQADALEIEAAAKRRLADEYDAAQERGEVKKAGNPNCSAEEQLPGPSDLGLTRKQIHEARTIRDAEDADPGVVRRTLDETLKNREEPTKASLRQAVIAAVKWGAQSDRGTDRRNPVYREPSPAAKAWAHVNGMCRSFSEWATEGSIAAAIRGREETETGQRARDDAAVRRAFAALSTIMETIDAE